MLTESLLLSNPIKSEKTNPVSDVFSLFFVILLVPITVMDRVQLQGTEAILASWSMKGFTTGIKKLTESLRGPGKQTEVVGA